MPNITLKGLPRDLHRELKNRARAHHRSLNKELIATLQAATASTSAVDAHATGREIQQARGRFKRALTLDEITSWKQQGRA